MSKAQAKSEKNPQSEATKRRYFIPELGLSVEAASAEEAGNKAKELAAQQQKEGDV